MGENAGKLKTRKGNRLIMNMLSIGMSEVVLLAPVYAVTPVSRQLLHLLGFDEVHARLHQMKNGIL